MLLRSRESILANDLAEWAKQAALPMQGEIDQVECVVVRAEDLLAQLPADQKVTVDDAIAVFRAMRDEVRSRAVTPVLLRFGWTAPPVNLEPGPGPATDNSAALRRARAADCEARLARCEVDSAGMVAAGAGDGGRGHPPPRSCRWDRGRSGCKG